MSNDARFLLLVVGACVIVSLVQSFIVRDESTQRRIYWTCTVIAVVAGLLAFEPNWGDGLIVAVSLSLFMGLNAYTRTSYVKIGGKVRMFGLRDNRTEEEVAADPDYDPAPDSYSGMLTAAKLWWLVVFLMAMSVVNIYAFLTDGRSEWVAGAIGLAFLLFMSIVTGLGDASWDYKVARGQYLQFALATAITAVVFGVCYLIAFQVGRRRPVRREQSMEYRAHPRHRRQGE